MDFAILVEQLDKLIEQLNTLNDIAQEEPQCAYATLVFSLQHKYTFLQRAIKVDPDIYKPLEEALRTLLSTIVGWPISDKRRSLMALPAQMGGLDRWKPPNERTKLRKPLLIP